MATTRPTAADAVHTGCKRLRALLSQPADALDTREALFVVDHMEAQFAHRAAGRADTEPAPEYAEPRIVVTATTRWP